MKALRTGEWNRRGAIAPNRIGQNAHAVDLDEQRRMSEPRHAQARCRTRLPKGHWIDEGQRRRRNTVLVRAEKIPHRRAFDAGLQSGRHRVSVSENTSVESRGRQHPLAAATWL